MEEIVQKVGPLFYPILACSVLGLAAVLERLVVLLRWRPVRQTTVADLVRTARVETRHAVWRRAVSAAAPLRDGVRLLLESVPNDKVHRDEAVSIWLQEVNRHLTRRLDFLRLIAALTPMLGLLGTVIGMVVAFQEIAGEQGPIGPALLADGLWQAMLTTVIGLAIALPVTVLVALLNAMADNRLADLTSALNKISLALEGGESEVVPQDIAT